MCTILIVGIVSQNIQILPLILVYKRGEPSAETLKKTTALLLAHPLRLHRDGMWMEGEDPASPVTCFSLTETLIKGRDGLSP